MYRLTKRYADGVAFCSLDLVNRVNENECIGLPISKLADFEDEAEQKEQGCVYCRTKKPLTDKVYSDGSKFDDLRGTSIVKYGKVYMIKSYVRKMYFQLFYNKNTEENWVVDINYCPMCGRKLGD